LKTLFLTAIILCLTGCATAPENIAPSYISEISYNQWTCDQLSQEQPRLVSALASATEAQRRCRNNDIAGVIFLGFPVSSLSGSNMASEVARLKGELQALQRAAILKNCNLPVVSKSALEPQKTSPPENDQNASESTK